MVTHVPQQKEKIEDGSPPPQIKWVKVEMGEEEKRLKYVDKRLFELGLCFIMRR